LASPLFSNNTKSKAFCNVIFTILLLLPHLGPNVLLSILFSDISIRILPITCETSSVTPNTRTRTRTHVRTSPASKILYTLHQDPLRFIQQFYKETSTP